MSSGERLDLLVVGAGPTGIAIGAEARQVGLSVLLVDRGPLTASLVEFPAEMTFFTTRERLEIAGIPFAIPEEKPNRRQALAYYRGVVERFAIPLALYEEVERIEAVGEEFRVASIGCGGPVMRRAGAVALANGYFDHPRRLGVPGEQLPWVHPRYHEPYAHVAQRVVVVGGGNSAAETALDLWRHGAQVTLVHRGRELKPSIKYWLKPDLENRIGEGSIRALFGARVTAFQPDGVEILRAGELEWVPAEAAYLLIGYEPDFTLARAAGVTIDPVTLAPAVDPATCESNVPGLYLAGTLLAGRATDQIFIENSRDHGGRIVRHLARKAEPGTGIAESTQLGSMRRDAF